MLLETWRYGSPGAEGNERETAKGFILASHRLHYVGPPDPFQIPGESLCFTYGFNNG